MKDKKKVMATEGTKKGVQPEEKGTPLTDEELAKVNAGGSAPVMGGFVLTVAATDGPMPQTREHILL